MRRFSFGGCLLFAVVAIGEAGCRTQPLDFGADLGPLLDGAAGNNADATYTASIVPTALNRISVLKADPDRNLCFSVLLVNPQTNQFPIMLPPMWAVESAWVQTGADQCAIFQPPSGAVRASGGSGQIDFAQLNTSGFPCSLDLHATLTFPPAQNPSFPRSEPLEKTGVTISGCLQM
jgi:hypothetical protein